MKKHLVLVCIAAVSGCAAPQAEYGGTGRTAQGQPVTAQIIPDPERHEVNIALQNPKGWSCSAAPGTLSADRTVYNAPLVCNGGLTGTLTLTANSAVASFGLSNKESGKILMGPRR